MEHTHTKAGPKAPEKDNKQDSGHMLEANAMGASPLDASSPPVQRRPATADTPASSSGPNPGLTKGPGGEASAAATSRLHSDKKLYLTSIDVPGVPKAVVSRLAGEEGIRQDVYRDSMKKLTVGLGHLLTEEERAKYKVGDVFSKEEIEDFAAKDFNLAWSAAERQCAQIGVSDADFVEALFHVNFQLGTGWHTKFKKTWELMQGKQWEAAAVEAADSDWYMQTPKRVGNFQAALRKLAGVTTTGSNAYADYKQDFLAKQKAKPDQAAPKGGSPTKAPQKGGEVPDLMTAQTKLKAMGLYPGKPDGRSGPMTTAAVKAFQAKVGLKVSGEVDASTWAALLGEGRSFMKGSGAYEGDAAHQDRSMDPREIAKWMKGQIETLNKPEARNGVFVDQKYWRTQLTGYSLSAETASGQGCRKVASEMVYLYLMAERPELVKELGLDRNGGSNAFGGNLGNDADGGYISILKEDIEKQSELTAVKNTQHPEHMRIDPQAPTGIKYLEECLGSKIPVVVGVDHTFGFTYNDDKTTDHFVTVTGMGIDENGARYFSFFDPGRSTKDAGTSNDGRNALTEVKPGVFKTKQKTGSSDKQNYYLVSVIVFPGDRERIRKQYFSGASKSK